MSAAALGASGLVEACAPGASPTPAQAPTAPAKSATSVAATKPDAKPAAPAATPAPTQAPAKAKALVRWRQVLPAARFESVFALMTKEKGFDRQRGLDLEIINIPASPNVVKALLAGEAETADQSFAGILISIGQGVPLKVLGSFRPGDTYALYARKDINSLSDLYGKNIGSGSTVSPIHQELFMLMFDAGLDPNRMNVVDLGGGSPVVFQAVAAGKVDAGLSGIEFLPDLPKFPDIKALFIVGDRMPNVLGIGTIASEKLIKERPDEITGFLAAYSLGHRYALEHRDETAALAAKLTGRPMSEQEWTFDWYVEHKTIDPNFDIPEDSLSFMQDGLIRLGQMPTKLPSEKFVDLSFRKKVLAELGLYKK